MDLMALLWSVVIGLFGAALAKFVMPGRDPGGILITILIGIAGSLLGTFIGRALWGGEAYQAGWIMSIIGALILLGLYRVFTGRRVA